MLVRLASAQATLRGHHAYQQPARMARKLQQNVKFGFDSITWECFRCHMVNLNSKFECSTCGARWNAKATNRGRSPARAAAGAAEHYDISTPRRSASPGRRRQQLQEPRGGREDAAPRPPRAPQPELPKRKQVEPPPWKVAADLA